MAGIEDWLNFGSNTATPDFYSQGSNYVPNQDWASVNWQQPNAPVMPGMSFSNAPAAPASGWAKLGDWWNNNSTNVMSGIGAISSLFNLYGGIKTLGLMSKNFKLNKKSTINNFNANAAVVNNQTKQSNAAMSNSALAGTSVPGAVNPNYEVIPKWT